MTPKPTTNLLRRRFLLLLLGFGPAFFQAATASVPVESRVQAVLVWGTDEAHPAGRNLKEVDVKLREKFGKIFKWQNYFEVSRKNAVVPTGRSQGIKLSEDCSVDIKILPDNTAEVKLIGKGKTIVTRRHSLTKPDALVLAGDDKNNTAWFVVLNFN